jgi:hypothetical protein
MRRKCRACGADGLWVNFARSLQPFGIAYSRLEWSRTLSISVFHRELVVGYLDHISVATYPVYDE